MKRAEVYQFGLPSPDDFSELHEAIHTSHLDPRSIRAVMIKTAGTGRVRDQDRLRTAMAFGELLTNYGVRNADCFVSVSGGCEGVISPHYTLFTVNPTEPGTGALRLALGVGRTRRFSRSEIGTWAQIDETSRIVRAITVGADIEEVHFVHAKAAAPRATAEIWSRSRAATALGIGIGTDELSASDIDLIRPLYDQNLYSSVASCSAKTGLNHTEVLVVGNSSRWAGDFAIAHTITTDIIDLMSLIDFFKPLTGRIAAIFAKCEADPRGFIRNQRHWMFEDPVSDLRWSRCAHGAVLAAATGITRLYVSSRAEHQGPIGGGTVAAIYSEEKTRPQR